MRTGNISIPQLLTTLLAVSAKSREQTPLTKMVKLMTDITKLDKYIRIGNIGDDIADDNVDDVEDEVISDSSV